LLDLLFLGRIYINRIKSDTGELIEYMKAYEITMLKELGKMTL